MYPQHNNNIYKKEVTQEIQLAGNSFGKLLRLGSGRENIWNILVISY
jgi:hypothetical protein